MHYENTVEASAITVNKRVLKTTKKDNRLRLWWDVNRFGTAVYSRKDDRFVGDSKSPWDQGKLWRLNLYTCYRSDWKGSHQHEFHEKKRERTNTGGYSLSTSAAKKAVNKFNTQVTKKVHTINKSPHVLHFTHLIMCRPSRLADLVIDFLTKTFLDIWMFRQHVEREG